MVNREGLTLQQWIDAAQAFGKKIERAQAIKAWKACVDPCEYNAP